MGDLLRFQAELLLLVRCFGVGFGCGSRSSYDGKTWPKIPSRDAGNSLHFTPSLRIIGACTARKEDGRRHQEILPNVEGLVKACCESHRDTPSLLSLSPLLLLSSAGYALPAAVVVASLAGLLAGAGRGRAGGELLAGFYLNYSTRPLRRQSSTFESALQRRKPHSFLRQRTLFIGDPSEAKLSYDAGGGQQLSTISSSPESRAGPVRTTRPRPLTAG